MKKAYEQPEIEVIEFKIDDVLTTSTDGQIEEGGDNKDDGDEVGGE
jgi:hypothetical protein